MIKITFFEAGNYYIGETINTDLPRTTVEVDSLEEGKTPTLVDGQVVWIETQEDYDVS